MNNLYIDIETIPTEDPWVIEDIAKKITPPGNMKKAETIEAWERDKKPALIQEKIDKTSLESDSGMILCIGVKLNDEPTVVFTGDEIEILNEFNYAVGEAQVKKGQPSAIKLIGHNIHGFDIPFIVHRMWINNIKPDPKIPYNVQKHSDKLFDTMYQWAGYSGMISLDRLCHAFGIKKKDGIDGSKVAQFYRDGRQDEIYSYCEDDVERVYELSQRMGLIQE